MRNMIWLWKHRHCWEQLRYLYSHRFEIQRIAAKMSLSPDAYQETDNLLACLRNFNRVPLARPWKVQPPAAPSKGI